MEDINEKENVSMPVSSQSIKDKAFGFPLSSRLAQAVNSPLKPVNDESRLNINSPSSKETPVSSPYKFIRQLDSAERWIERTAVVTKQDHKINVENARDILLDVISNLPLDGHCNQWISQAKQDDVTLEASSAAKPSLDIDELSNLLGGLDLDYRGTPMKPKHVTASHLPENDRDCSSNFVPLPDQADPLAPVGMLDTLPSQMSNNRSEFEETETLPVNKKDHLLADGTKKIEDTAVEVTPILVGQNTKDNSSIDAAQKSSLIEVNTENLDKFDTVAVTDNELETLGTLNTKDDNVGTQDTEKINHDTQDIENITDGILTDKINHGTLDTENSQDDTNTVITEIKNHDTLDTENIKYGSAALDLDEINQDKLNTKEDKLTLGALEVKDDKLDTLDTLVVKDDKLDMLDAVVGNDNTLDTLVGKGDKLDTLDTLVVKDDKLNTLVVKDDKLDALDTLVVKDDKLDTLDALNVKDDKLDTLVVKDDKLDTLDTLIVKDDKLDALVVKDDKLDTLDTLDIKDDTSDNFDTLDTLPVNLPKADTLEALPAKSGKPKNLEALDSLFVKPGTPKNLEAFDCLFVKPGKPKNLKKPDSVPPRHGNSDKLNTLAVNGSISEKAENSPKCDPSDAIKISQGKTDKPAIGDNFLKHHGQPEPHTGSVSAVDPMASNGMLENVNKAAKLEVDDKLDIAEEEFRPATEVFNDPAFFDMLEKAGNSQLDNAKRGSVLLRFDPLQARRESGLSKALHQENLQKSFLQESRNYSPTDNSVCLFGTPPKVSRRRVSILNRQKAKAANSVFSIEEASEVDMIFAQDDNNAVDVMLQENLFPSETGELLEIPVYTEAQLKQTKTQLTMEFQELMLKKDSDFQKRLKEQEENYEKLIGEAKAEAEREISERAKEADSYKKKIACLEEKLSNATKVFEECTELVTKAVAEKESLSHELGEVRKSQKQLEQDSKTWEESFDALYHRYEKMKEEMVKVAHNNEVLQKALVEGQEQRKTILDSKAKMKETMQAKIEDFKNFLQWNPDKSTPRDHKKLLTLSENNEVLQKALVEGQEQRKTILDSKAKMKETMQAKIEEVMASQSTQEGDIAKLEAALKRKAIQIQGLESALEQKKSENKELTELCDTLISKAS
ncbi:transforming acidic coiled-coil-containing protein 3 [Elysia marginata]|uniref:Transforming acidic coiled-coil-containing protein 3 n=1 Tax=Elysia marginata TaxID=1093978 RepID=A0AAV4ENC0_9GAST|nr:transforming acidic coiled-coil-containing protein 3 [Elysia marginata]